MTRNIDLCAARVYGARETFETWLCSLPSKTDSVRAEMNEDKLSLAQFLAKMDIGPTGIGARRRSKGSALQLKVQGFR